MAKNVLINGVSYNSVPYVSIPLSGQAGNAVFYETSDATAGAAQILSGYSAYGASGKIDGSASTVTVSQDVSTKVLTIS